MITEKKILTLLGLLIALCLMLSACDGSLGFTGGSQEDSGDPSTTDEPGMGQAGENESSESNDDSNFDPVPLVECSRTNLEFYFTLDAYEVTWAGPPTTKIEALGYIERLEYTLGETEDGAQGSFSSDHWHVNRTGDVTVTFGDCREKPFKGTVTYTPKVWGTCKGNTIGLSILEDWDSVMMLLGCDAGSDICGEEPCPYTHLLPFSMGGPTFHYIEFKLLNDGSIYPEKQEIPFKGVGAVGKKTYYIYTFTE